jgi:hypothetical protein
MLSGKGCFKSGLSSCLKGELAETEEVAAAFDEAVLQAAERVRSAHNGLKLAIRAEGRARYEAALTRLKEVAGPLHAREGN